MARRRSSSWKPEITNEEFEEWHAAVRDNEAMKAETGEGGGPVISFVPRDRELPLAILPDEVDGGPALPVSPAALRAVPGGDIGFEPEPSRKVGGWSAARQRLFVEALAETGSVHVATRAAGLSARSAYGLRVRSAAFARAWDNAQQLAVGRLSALVFDRAIHGRVEQIYQGSELMAEKRLPSDKLLMWLLTRLDPRRFAAPWERRAGDLDDPQADAQLAFPALLGALTDVPVGD
ncbi:MAG: hypothetical protein ABIO85_09505 [Sphingomicrobium sp.]